jgi:hypothetical protein
MTPEQLAKAQERAAGSRRRNGQWSLADLLAAETVDTLRRINTTLINVNGGKAAIPPPIPRPGVQPTAGRMSGQQLAAAQEYIAKLRATHRAMHGD